jgi:hypothetical protein
MTQQVKVPAPPKSLGAHGRKLWREHTSKFVFDPSELEILLAMCSAADQLQRIALALRQTELTSVGSAGQLTGHPLLTEYRLHAETLRRLSAQLKLPDATVPKHVRKSNPGRVPHLRGA